VSKILRGCMILLFPASPIVGDIKFVRNIGREGGFYLGWPGRGTRRGGPIFSRRPFAVSRVAVGWP